MGLSDMFSTMKLQTVIGVAFVVGGALLCLYKQISSDDDNDHPSDGLPQSYGSPSHTVGYPRENLPSLKEGYATFPSRPSPTPPRGWPITARTDGARIPPEASEPPTTLFWPQTGVEEVQDALWKAEVVRRAEAERKMAARWKAEADEKARAQKKLLHEEQRRIHQAEIQAERVRARLQKREREIECERLRRVEAASQRGRADAVQAIAVEAALDYDLDPSSPIAKRPITDNHKHDSYPKLCRSKSHTAKDKMLSKQRDAKKALEEHRLCDHLRFTIEAEEWRTKMLEHDAQASKWIFTRNNATLPKHLVDFHELHVWEAEARLERVLEEVNCARLITVYFIVGKGNHSTDGKAKMGPALEAKLRSYNVTATTLSTNKGRLEVNMSDFRSRKAMAL